MKRSVFCSLVIIVCLFTCINAVQASATKGLVTLDFKDTDVREVFRALSLQAGVSILVDPDVQGTVTLRLQDVPWEDGFRQILSSYGWTYEVYDNVYRVRKGNDGIPLLVEEYNGKLVISSEGASLEQVLLDLARVSNKSIVPLTALQGNVYARLTGVTFEEALEYILIGRGYTWTKEQGVYLVDSQPKQIASNLPIIRVSGEFVSIESEKAEFRELLYAAASHTGQGIILDPTVSGTITVNLRDIPSDELIPLLARYQGLNALPISDGAWWVGRVSSDVQDVNPLKVKWDNGLLTVQADDVPISEVLQTCAAAAGIDIVVSPQLTSLARISVQNRSFLEVLDYLARAHQLAVEELGSVLVVYHQDGTASQSVANSGPRFGSDQEDFKMTVDSSGLITLWAEEAPVRRILTEMAAQCGQNIVVAPEVQGSISIVLNNLPWADAFESLLALANLRSQSIGALTHIVLRQTPDLPPGINRLVVEDGRLTVDLLEVPLEELVQALCLSGGAVELPAVVVDGTASGTLVTGTTLGLPITSALKQLLEPLGLEVADQGEFIRISKAKPDAPYEVSHRDGVLDVVIRRGSLRETLQEIAKQTGVSFVLPDKMPENVSTSQHGLSPSVTVRQLLEPFGYSLVSYPDGSDDLEPWQGTYQVVVPDTRSIRVVVENGLVSLEANDAKFEDIINEIAFHTKENVVLEAENFPAMSVRYHALPVDVLLKALVEHHGAVVVREQDLIYIRQEKQSVQEETPSDGILHLEIDGLSIELRFENAVLSNLLNAIVTAGGPKFMVEKGVGEQRVNGTISGSDAESAIRSFLIEQGYSVLSLGDHFLVRSKNAGPLIHFSEDLFYLDLDGGDLAAAIREIADLAGRQIVIYPTVKGNISNLRVYGVTFEEALAFLLRGTTFSYFESNDVYHIGEGVTPRSDSPGFTQTTIVQLRHINPSNLLSVLPPSIPSQNIRAIPGQNSVVVFGNEDLVELVKAFIASVDRPPQIVPELVPIQYADPDEIMSVIATRFPSDSYQYIPSLNALLLTGSVEANQVIRDLVKVMDTADMASRTIIIPLQHISAADAKTYMSPAIDTSNMLPLPDQNALAVTGRESFLREVTEYLKEIDVRNPQILFEVLVLEIGGRVSEQLGFSGSTKDGSLTFDLLSGAPLTLSFGTPLFANPQLLLTLSALVQEGEAKLLANPQLITLNGREASFNVLTTSRYWAPQTIVDPDKDEDGKNGNSVIPAFRTIETGIRLRLKPWVSASGEITIELQPEISDSAGASSGSGLPSTNDRAVQTTVRVRDGETVVIGGLIQRTERTEINKVPLLGDIPIVGKLFQSETNSETETEFVIAITSHLIDFWD